MLLIRFYILRKSNKYRLEGGDEHNKQLQNTTRYRCATSVNLKLCREERKAVGWHGDGRHDDAKSGKVTKRIIAILL